MEVAHGEAYMSENSPANIQLNNGNGTVTFAADVVATIAGLAANEVDGVASMGGASGGIAEVFSRKQGGKAGKGLTRGVRVDIADGSVAVHLTIVVDYGFPVPDVAGSIQENVKKAIETMSGLSVSSVDVYVQAMSFEREKSEAVASLESSARALLQRGEDGAEAGGEEYRDSGADGGEGEGERAPILDGGECDEDEAIQ